MQRSREREARKPDADWADKEDAENQEEQAQNSKIIAQNHGLKYPKCVLTQKGWYLIISEAFGAIWMD